MSGPDDVEALAVHGVGHVVPVLLEGHGEPPLAAAVRGAVTSGRWRDAETAMAEARALLARRRDDDELALYLLLVPATALSASWRLHLAGDRGPHLERAARAAAALHGAAAGLLRGTGTGLVCALVAAGLGPGDARRCAAACAPAR